MSLFRLAVAGVFGVLMAVPLLAADRAQVAHDRKIFVATKAAETPARQHAVQQLLAKAAAQRAVGVIVGLDLVLRDAERLSPAEARSQAATLERAQDALIARTQGRRRGVKKFTVIPFVAMQAARTDLVRLLADPAVRSIEEDVTLQVQLKQSTRIVGAKRLWDDAKVTGTNQIVAIVDTGVAALHPMMNGKIVDEACFSTNAPGLRSFCPGGLQKVIEIGAAAPCPKTIVNCDHGTHVASIAAGKSDALSGVAPDAQVMAIQVGSKRIDNQGGCGAPPCVEVRESDVIRALGHVYKRRNKFGGENKKIAAVNVSLGLGEWNQPCDGADADKMALAEQVNLLRDARIPTIVGTGNFHYDGAVAYPACLSAAIAVGAATKDDALWVHSDHSGLVKLMAPGVGIKAAVPKGSACPMINNKYCVYDGTSQAAPHVAGAWALLKSVKPNAEVLDVLAALNCSGRLIQGSSAFHASNKVHRPRIDVRRAHSVLIDPETDETYRFNNGIGKWNPVLGDWSASGGNFLTMTSSWPAASAWGMASLSYCSSAFTVEAKIAQLDPVQMNNYPLETGLLLASHITQIIGEVRASGHLFVISSLAGGWFYVKRIDDKRFDAPVGSDEANLCEGSLPNLKLDKFHTLRIDTAGRFSFFYLDGERVCAVVEQKPADAPPDFREDKRRYAPPAKIALVARRGTSGTYLFKTNSVKITTP